MIDMGGNTRHQAAVAGVAWLAELDFASGMVRVTTAPQSLVVGGNTYTGLGSMVGVADLSESADSTAERIALTLAVTNTAMLSLTLGSVEGYRGRAVRLYLLLHDEAWQPVGSPIQRWSGVMSRVQITRHPARADDAGASTGVIEMQCSRSGMARARNYQGLRLTHQQQTVRFPDDTGLRYMRTLIDQPTPWLSKEFLKR